MNILEAQQSMAIAAFRVAAVGDLHLSGADDDAVLMRRLFRTVSESAETCLTGLRS
jgi:hypothetical protein